MAPLSSSSRIWNRACWPPESDSNRCSAACASSYRSSARAAGSRGIPSRWSSPRCRISSSVRPISSGCSCVCTNQPGRTRAPSRATAGVPHRLDRRLADRAVLDVRVRSPRRQESQEVRLAGAVRAQHGDPLAVPDLEVERLHQPGQLEVLADDGALAGAAALEPHLHLLLARLRGRWAGLLELPEPGLRRPVLRGEPVVVLRLDLVAQHQRLELGVLLVPAPTQLLEALESRAPRLVVGREPAGVGPHRVAGGPELDGDHARRRVVEQLSVVADEQDRLGRLLDPLLQPGLARYVEEVVRLVEKQDLVGATEQELQHQPLLLAAREGGQVAVLGAVVRQTPSAAVVQTSQMTSVS